MLLSNKLRNATHIKIIYTHISLYKIHLWKAVWVDSSCFKKKKMLQHSSVFSHPFCEPVSLKGYSIDWASTAEQIFSHRTHKLLSPRISEQCGGPELGTRCHIYQLTLICTLIWLRNLVRWTSSALPRYVTHHFKSLLHTLDQCFDLIHHKPR